MRGLKFTYKVPNQTAPNEIALDWSLWNQTKACIARSSCVDNRENSMTKVN